jgi:signal transduction histidine kinase
MNPLHSVGARLSLALALVVAAALAVVYVGVVPSLQQSLVKSKEAELRRAARHLPEQVDINNAFPADVAATAANARVVVYQILISRPSFLAMPIYADSNRVGSKDVLEDAFASRAARTGTLTSGTVTRDGVKFAEAAFPARGFVYLISAPLHDSLGNVALVRRRILVVGLLALLAAVVVGYGAATLFARRIRRLEQAAEAIAAGDFGTPVVDPGRDELGQLAAAFERMRGQLGQLEHARREFIANASHELRTPLFSLGGFLELLADEDLDEETKREFMTTMREQVDRLTRLATDLLDLSRLDAGRVRVELVPVDLGETVATLCDEFRAVAQAGGHRLEGDAGEAPALADEERALQIGRMLVENALVHTPPGTSVRVRSESGDEYAALIVEDDGPGVPPEHAEQVFERFYRVEGGSVASGSGLGLAIARELAELMGGAVVLESRPGRTSVRLELPPGTALDARYAAEPAPPKKHVKTADAA